MKMIKKNLWCELVAFVLAWGMVGDQVWGAESKGSEALSYNDENLLGAASVGECEYVEHYLNSGANVNIQEPAGQPAWGDSLWTPLHKAASGGHLDVVRLLLDREANKDAQSKNGWTPLHVAVKGGWVEVVRILLDREANTNIKSSDQLLPIDVAIVQQKNFPEANELKEIIKMLGGGVPQTPIEQLKTSLGQFSSALGALSGKLKTIAGG